MQIQRSFRQLLKVLKMVWKTSAEDPHDAVDKYGVETGKRSTRSRARRRRRTRGMARLQQLLSPPRAPNSGLQARCTVLGVLYLYSIFKIS